MIYNFFNAKNTGFLTIIRTVNYYWSRLVWLDSHCFCKRNFPQVNLLLGNGLLLCKTFSFSACLDWPLIQRFNLKDSLLLPSQMLQVPCFVLGMIRIASNFKIIINMFCDLFWCLKLITLNILIVQNDFKV